MRWVKFFFSLLLTLLVGAVLLFPFGSTPFAFGTFFDPFVGFWSNAESNDAKADLTLSLAELKGEVVVKYDKRGVPHIFAGNSEDLFFVQGYITAKDRLWQMEFQTMAAGGRLTEIVGIGKDSVVLNLDRSARRKGMVFGAENSVEKMKADDASYKALQAYTKGVNTYIESLSPGDLPIEYKLLGYQPEQWTILKSALLQKYMASTLSWRSNDIPYTHAVQLWGEKVFNTLYPEYHREDEPIVPKETRWRRREVLPAMPIPTAYHPDSMLIAGDFAPPSRDEQIVGSNNWAVSPSKSKSGHALLANDPHLSLNLPSIWYELQLQAPGINVYGVSLPGSPAVIIGFNDSIAWGVTNGSRDVLDHYTITYKNDKKKEYLHDGQWHLIEERIEEHLIKGGEIYYDTVRYTHIGPVMYEDGFAPKGKPLAVRWMAHDPSNELETFMKLNVANNYEEYVDAISTFVCPAQNFVFASVSGDIAIWQQGKIPHKWKDQGKFILDGSRRDHIWEKFIPQKDNPHAFNPPQGFVQSANQHPTTARYPYETQGRYEDFRGRRLFSLLSEKDSMTLEDMQAIQLDNYYQGAADILPFMLSELDTLQLNAVQRKAYDALKQWNYQYTTDKFEPSIYQKWWGELYRSVWDDEYKNSPLALAYVKNRTFMQLLQDSLDLSYYRIIGDSTDYSRAYHINTSFKKALSKLKEERESDNFEDWTWSEQKKTSINHLSRTLTPFSRLQIPTNGNGGILNATGTQTGPSWRMVVELGPEIKAYAIYPGGQSGNPGSPSYDSFINDWVDGKYYKLDFMKGPEVDGDYHTLKIKKKNSKE
ncbi:MAG: penicillin acylase family protein [Bacteroidia bacterium]|nr:penicillin acylase family protein [Bacteroidia bacterium]